MERTNDRDHSEQALGAPETAGSAQTRTARVASRGVRSYDQVFAVLEATIQDTAHDKEFRQQSDSIYRGIRTMLKVKEQQRHEPRDDEMGSRPLISAAKVEAAPPLPPIDPIEAELIALQARMDVLRATKAAVTEHVRPLPQKG